MRVEQPVHFKMKVAAVDLFSGAGGLTYGLEQAGIDVEKGVDADPDSRFPYEHNTSADFLKSNVEPLAKDPERIARMYPWDADLKVLAAGVPCQPYSTMNHASFADQSEHEKWGLLNDVRRIVEYVEPDVVVTENVMQLRKDETYSNFIDTLESLGYHINSDENKKVYAPEYGVPQKRKRWLLLASKVGPIGLPEPEYQEGNFPTVNDAIGHLPPIQAGEKHPELELHRSRSLSDKNVERIANMPPGGDWTVWEENGQEHLLASCHLKDSGRSYKAPYSRLEADEPAPTITTQFYNYGSGRFGHYDTDQNRALSLLEGALLQTFPQDFKFYEEWGDVGVKNLGRLIGNAVPPLLGEKVGEAILEHAK